MTSGEQTIPHSTLITFRPFLENRKKSSVLSWVLWATGLVALCTAFVMLELYYSKAAYQKKSETTVQSENVHVGLQSQSYAQEHFSRKRTHVKRGSPRQDSNSSEYDRLPRFAYPTLYEIKIHPFFENFTFKGKSNITIQIVNNNTSVLALNAYKLFNLKASISGEHNEDNLAIRQARFDVIELSVSAPLKVGSTYVLSMEFEGYITDDLVGIYRSSYTDRNNQSAYMIATHFEAVRARRAFPCWDEPIFRASFKMTLFAPKSATVIANMPESTRYPNPDNSSEVIVEFQPSPKMPTYLVAFAIGDLDYIEGVDSYNTIHRVYTPAYRADEALYALNVSIKSIELLSVYFKYLYPLPKLYSLALKDFLAGAMENWGLVTYREARILVNDGTSLSSKFSTCNTICHENSHMWFGDLVTMGWWSDLWLNEGFATWSAYRIENIMFPEYQSWNKFMQSRFKSAIVADAKESTHQIVIEIQNTDAVESIFDSISYNKGAAIIRMLEEYIGADAFRNSLQSYMLKYAYKNAFTADLWAEISEVSGQEITSMMQGWTYQPGFPYITAAFESTDTGVSIKLHQQRFLSNGKFDPDGTLWEIPISVCDTKCSGSRIHKFIMRQRNITYNLANVDSTSWFKLNAEKSGFYIVKYELSMLTKLKAAVLNGELETLDRLDLESDLYMLATAGFEAFSTYLDFLRSYESEIDYTVLSDISDNLQTLSGLMEYMNLDTNLGVYINSLYANPLKYVGLDLQLNDSDETTSLRAVIFKQLGLIGNEEVVGKVRSLFQTALENPQFQPNLRPVILALNVRNGGATEYNLVKRSFFNAATSEEEVNALTALGYTTDPDCALDLVHFACLSGEVRIQDVFYPLRELGYSRLGRDIIWSYVKANITQLLEKFSVGSFMDDIVSRSLNGFASEEMINEMKTFFEQNGVPINDLLITNTLEQIQIRSGVVNRSRDDLDTYLKNFGGFGTVNE